MTTTQNESQLSGLLSYIVNNPDSLATLDWSNDELRLLCELLAKSLALQEAVIVQLTKEKEESRSALMAVKELVGEQDEVINDMLALLRQNPENSNWPSSTKNIKPFDKAANSYAKNLDKIKGKLNGIFDKFEPKTEDPAPAPNTGADSACPCMGSSPNKADDAATTATDSVAPDGKAAEGQPAESGADTTTAPDGKEAENQPTEASAAGNDANQTEDQGANSGNANGNSTKPHKKSGGVPGHKGSNLHRIKAVPDKVIVNLPVECIGCSHYDECLKASVKSDCRTVVNVVWSLEQINSYLGTVTCRLTGKTVKGEHPKGFDGRIQYGNSLKALAVSLYSVGYMSMERIAGFIKDVLGLSISTGTIANFIQEAGQLGLEYYDFIRLKTREALQANTDETSAFVYDEEAGKVVRWWIHTVVTPHFTYMYGSEHRGFDAILEDGVLLDLSLILISDCWSSYFKLEKVTHSLCCAHLVRVLRAILENDPSQVWAQKMLDFLQELLDRKKELVAKAMELGLNKDLRDCGPDEIPQLSDEEVKEIMRRFFEIVKEGFEFNHVPFVPEDTKGKKGKRKKQSKAVNLLIRLRDHAEDWLRFITDIRVPFSNNTAERSVRSPKIHQHILHFSRTILGFAIRLILYSINQSAQQNQISRYVAIQKMFEGVPPEELFGCEVSQAVRDSAPKRSDKVVLPKRKGKKAAGDEDKAALG